jgi:hypothetical protein
MIGIYRKKEMEYLLEFLITKFPIQLFIFVLILQTFDIYTSTTVTSVFIGWKICKAWKIHFQVL